MHPLFITIGVETRTNSLQRWLMPITYAINANHLICDNIALLKH